MRGWLKYMLISIFLALCWTFFLRCFCFGPLVVGFRCTPDDGVVCFFQQAGSLKHGFQMYVVVSSEDCKFCSWGPYNSFHSCLQLHMLFMRFCFCRFTRLSLSHPFHEQLQIRSWEGFCASNSPNLTKVLNYESLSCMFQTQVSRSWSTMPLSYLKHVENIFL